MSVDRGLLERLPKTDLHVHLDGSLRPETIWELAETDAVELPFDSADAVRSWFTQELPERDLVAYLNRFDVTTSVMQTEEALERIAFELVEDAAAENVWYMEVRYAPILSTKRGLSPRQVVDSVKRGLARGMELHPRTQAYQIICGLRHFEPERALRMAALAVEYKDRGVVAFDLAGAEVDNPAKWFREAFYIVRDANLNVTVHAGEAYGPESIHQALHYTGAHRIGHGVRLREDEDLVEYVRDHRIPLEMCPTSNVQTGAVDSIEEHPIREYFDRGLRVTVNTDNRLMSNTTMTREIELLVEHLGFDLEEVKKLLLNGFKSAFLRYPERKALIGEASDALGGMS
ncbi:MAG TPA: adenosine deaminase [Gemmatimonadota bacterium]|jgi:adenosine deaminase|nr:adenosine deaminase [Gemmatimonadota bacterium]